MGLGTAGGIGSGSNPSTVGGFRWSAVLAASVALGLGAVAAVLLVVGHHPWDGRVVVRLAGSHGLHRGDVAALGPAVVAPCLAWWCLRQGRTARPLAAVVPPDPSGPGAAHR